MAHEPESAGSLVQGLRCSEACGIFLDQGSNPCPCIGSWISIHWTTREIPLPPLNLLLSQILQAQQSYPFQMGLPSLIFRTLRNWLAGIGKAVEEEHKGLLCPKLDGGYPSPPRKWAQLPQILPPTKETSSLVTWTLLRTLTDNNLRHPDVWGYQSMWSGPMPAWGGWPAGGRCSAEQKWLKPDITSFAFPVEKRGRFTFLFYLFFRDQSDIFNSSSFLLSTGVSCGVALRKDRAMT